MRIEKVVEICTDSRSGCLLLGSNLKSIYSQSSESHTLETPIFQYSFFFSVLYPEYLISDPDPAQDPAP
jgi:hypothetical protein